MCSMISEMACAAISFALVRVPKHFPFSKVYDGKCIIPGIVDQLAVINQKKMFW